MDAGICALRERSLRHIVLMALRHGIDGAEKKRRKSRTASCECGESMARRRRGGDGEYYSGAGKCDNRGGSSSVTLSDGASPKVHGWRPRTMQALGR